MRGGRPAPLLLWIAVLLLPLAPAVLGQDAGPVSAAPGASDAYLHLGAEEVARVTPEAGNELCEQPPASGVGIPQYAISAGLPAKEGPQRVRSAPGTDEASCFTQWTYNVTRPFSLEPGAVLTFWVVCDQGPVVGTERPGGEGLRVDIL
ncbi:MAG: hypothetical protein R3185_07965, partial [Candidatus Thermoplasmatota archaeon]|nr:hypothetical protein [Candidatus Thermoplasmatota archaeon]